jgi:hypothetical protein
MEQPMVEEEYLEPVGGEDLDQLVVEKELMYTDRTRDAEGRRPPSMGNKSDIVLHLFYQTRYKQLHYNCID